MPKVVPIKPATCAECGAEFEPAGTGRPRKFCSDACKSSAHAKRTGQPAGRPPDPLKQQWREACRGHAAEALEFIMSVVRDEDAPLPDRLKAAVFVAEQGNGKAPASKPLVEASATPGKVVIEVVSVAHGKKATTHVSRPVEG